VLIRFYVLQIAERTERQMQLASHPDTPFGHQFRHVLERERIPEIPAHSQNDHFSRKLASFERIVRVDRHGTLPYQNMAPNFAPGPASLINVALKELLSVKLAAKKRISAY
jgi:hypothetical protein